MNSEEFDGLVAASRAHPVFKLDWSRYQSLDFADTFLPYVQGYKATGLYLFDGGKLFSNTRKADKRVLPLSNDKKLITTIGYTYPKGVTASEKIETAIAANHELLIFMEVDINDSVQVTFKAGNNFKQFLKQYPNARSINESYTTDINDIQNYFNGELLQENTLQYVLDTLEIPFDLFEKEFLFSLDDFANDLVLFDKYKPTVFIKKSQEEVRNESKNEQPADDEIHIWLVSEDYIKYDTDFILLQIGKKVGKDFNDRKITKAYLSQFILDVIKAELDLNVFDTKLVSAKTSQFLNQASFVAAISSDFEKNPKGQELFKKSPNAYFGIKALTHYAKKIEQYTLLPNRWISNDPKYNPLIDGDVMDNAFLCGLINGMIDSLKGIPEGLAFFWEINTDVAKQEEFVKSIKKLLEEENLIELIVKGTIEGYQKAEQPEELAYEFGKDIIAVIETVLGIVTFFEGGGISSFINGTKNVLRYLKRFGKKGVKLKKSKIKEIFESDFIKKLDGESGIFGGRKLSQTDLDDWAKRLEADFKTKIQRVESFDEPNVLAQFDSNTNTIKYKDDVTEFIMAHESFHAEEMHKIGFNEYVKDAPLKGIKTDDYTTENWQRLYKREKYVYDKLIENADKFGLNNDELNQAFFYFDGRVVLELELRGIEIPEI